VLERAVATFTAYQSYADALRLTDQQLQLAPDDAVALANKGNLCILTHDFSNAIPPLTLALSLTNTYGAGSIAPSPICDGPPGPGGGRLPGAPQAFPTAYRAYRGLGDIALQKRDTNTALRYYEQYLSKAGADTDEAKAVAAQLKSLQQGRH